MFQTFEIVKELANKKGLSLNEVEERIGFTKNTLYGLKTSKPSSERLMKIADFFGVSTDYLLGRSKTPKEEKFAQFFRVDTSDLSDAEKAEFEEEMKAMSDFIAERIRLRRENKGG